MLKKFLRCISTLLVLVMLVNMVPVQALGSLQSGELDRIEGTEPLETIPVGTIPEIGSADSLAEAVILSEIPSERTQYSKEFLLSNGLHMATLYAEPVHYEKDGVWEEIDNTLKTVKNGTYQNTAGVWNVSFPSQFGDSQSVTIEKDGYTLSFGMPQKLTDSGMSVMSAQADTFAVSIASTATAEVTTQLDVSSAKAEAQYPETVLDGLASRMTYQNVHSNVDVIYDLQSNKVKESVVLEHYDSSLQGFRYILNVGTMVPVLQADGGILLYAPDGETVVMVMPAPYLVDDAMEISTDIRVSLTGKGEQYVLTYLLPQSWLAEANRQWPIVLDPVVQADLEVTNIRDAVVASTYTFSHLAGFLDVGYEPVPGIKRTFLKYTNLPQITSSDVIVAATMTMRQMYYRSVSIPAEVHKVNGDWDSTTITWENMPGYDETVVDFVMGNSAQYYHWDVTDIVQEWYNTGNNYGMLFKTSDSVENGGIEKFRQFYSSDYGTVYRPTLQIMFRNNNGLEGFWDYASASAGRAGVGYVNTYTGNLVWSRSDMGFSGNRMPVTVGFTYNTNDAANDSFGMGYGWRSNYNELAYQWDEDKDGTIQSDEQYYIWEDSDGTKHYFEKKSSNTYEDEDGLELTLTTSGSGSSRTCMIADKNGNKRYFDVKGRLYKLENNQQTKSSITISYIDSTSKRIATVTDGADRKYEFSYGDDELLNRIRYKGIGETEIAHVEYFYIDGNLSTVKYQDGEEVGYTYTDNHLLETATDIDGYQLIYTYAVDDSEFAPPRIATVHEEDGSAKGGKLSFLYEQNQTRLQSSYMDADNNEIIESTLYYQFNNWGNTVVIQDDEGRAQYAKFARNDANDTAGKGNQLTLSSKMQNTVVNLLTDSSFENGTLWTAAFATAGIATTGYSGSKSLSLSGTGNAKSGGITAKAGKTYTFSGYVKTDSGTVELAILGDSGNRHTDEVSASEWTRLEVSYTNTSDADQTIYAVIYGDDGTAYLDCVQMEQMPTASRYNLVQNGDFATTSGWTTSNLASGDTVTAAPTGAPMLSTNAYQITGDYLSAKSIKQTISVSGGEGDSFVFGGWAMGKSASLEVLSNGVTKDFAIKCTIHYTDNTTKEEKVQFNPNVTQWQFASGAIAAEKAFSSITIEAVYDKNANTVYFDGIQVFQEEFGVSYTYDDEGNVISTVDLQQKNTTYEYDDANNLTEIIQDGKTKMAYTYDDHHNVLTATTEEGLKYEFEYDAYGNNIKVSITENGLTISSSADYTDNGNQLASATDALGNTTTYSYNINTGLLEWVQLPEDTDATRTEYTYDEMYRTASIVADTETGLSLSAEYTYEDDLLTAIETPTTIYTFEYGNFSLRSKVKIGNRNLASYTYENGTNRLIKLDYGNQDSVQYTYDDIGRLIKETYEDNQTVSYAYDNSGNLATVTDSETGIVTTYYYDLLNRMSGYREKSLSLDHAVTYIYDAENNLSSMTEVINGVSKTYTYTYDEDNRLISMSVGGTTVTYTYDDFGRIRNRTVKNDDTVIHNNTVSYQETAETTSNQIVEYAGYSYAYDKNGNITYYGDGRRDENFYQYDSQNQLIRAESYELGYIWIWEYDNAGNILSRTKYDFFDTQLETALETVSYGYDSEWGDLLTSYGGKNITYDTIGNPLSDGTWTYTWKHGKQLTSMFDETTTWNFTYNADGLRTQRTNGTTTYTYVYNGSQLVQMTVDGFTYDFTYDASGTPLTVTVDGNVYYYATNLQGDVVGIKDHTGRPVAAYTYDAWGNVTYYNNHPAVAHNPLLYRGYVYDHETGLYYLQSRYYNPEWGRFINGDVFPATGQDFAGNNMFAYCGNNPISREDDGGEFWNVVIGAVVGAIVSGVTTAVQTYKETGKVDWEKTAISAGVGAVSGGVAATGFGPLAQAGITASATFIGDVATQKICEDKSWSEINYTKSAHNALLSAGTSLIGSSYGSVTSGGYSITGNTLVSNGKDKLLTGYVRQNANQSYSKLIKQGQQMVKEGMRYINTGRGISSVTGTILTWGIGNQYSWSN